MSTLYLDRKNLTLKLDGHTMALYENEQKSGTVPFHLLAKVVVIGNVNFESRLLSALSEHQVDVLFLSARNNVRCTASFNHSHNDVRRKLAQLALFNRIDLQFQLAQQLVLAKTLKQQQFLQLLIKQRADLRKPLFNALKTLATIVDKLNLLSLESGSIATLLGLEGAAAAAYFPAFSKLFAPSLEFSQRKKRPPTDPVNACLSLGYTLLHFEAVTVCHMAGLDPLLGFYHQPALGRESLACDLIEPLRPRLDKLVWTLFRDRLLLKEHFSFQDGRCLLNKAGRKCFYAQYEEFAYPVRRLLRMQAHQLAKHYMQFDAGVV